MSENKQKVDDMADYFLAIDIGASSGRHIVGHMEGGRLATDEVYRFPTGVTKKGGRLQWDIGGIYENVLRGIREAFSKYPKIVSLSIDTWGADYVLLDGRDNPIYPCYSYRDSRTMAVTEDVHKIVPFSRLYEKTGIQFQPFNTIYQLYADKKAGRLDGAATLLMLPEYFTFLLTGAKMREYTNATTTGLLNPDTKRYDEDILSALGFPERLFPNPVMPGASAGTLKADVAKYVGGSCEVLMCASHDTASSVEGMDIVGDNPYISSGTWSLLGLKVPEAIRDEKSRESNYTNEGGIGYIRYQKNIMGMWVVNELKRALNSKLTFSRMVELARESDFAETVDINSEAFLAPSNMKDAFDAALSERPESVGDYFRCAMASIAESYKKALGELSRNTGKSFSRLYIYGGGANNSLLNEMTRKACGIDVEARPVEASAVGNLRVQMRKFYGRG